MASKSRLRPGRSVKKRPAVSRFLLRDDFRHLGSARDLVGRNDAPERADRVRGRPLVGGVEAVAVGGEDGAVLVDLAGRELQRGLQQLLHLPLVGALVPGDAEEPAGAPVADEIRLVEAGVVRDAQALRRAAEAVFELRRAWPRLLMRILGDRQDADDRALV